MVASGRTRGSPALLEVRGLNKTYRSRRGGREVEANRQIDLTVHAGEVVALLGPNGAGKSTLLKQIAGQLLPTSGTIQVVGVDMVRDPESAKRRVSTIPQECAPVNDLTVEEHVRYFAALKGMPRQGAREAVDAILTQVGLTSYRDTLVRELSGGYKRRVLIAVALGGEDCRLLLLDEPTTGLDPEARRSVWKLIEGLRAQGRGVLLTTHYIEEAEFLADHVAIIDQGRLVVQGSVDDVRARWPYRGRLEIRHLDKLAEGPRAEVERLRQRWRVQFERDDRIRWEIPDPFSPEMVGELARLTSLGVLATLSPATLEDVYLSLVEDRELQ
ncbi:MAG: ABC transporter ATP-binding protein [Thermoplasmata archaeon]|nr:ABC transporter ATP-binding protein [Thermoplasmata archaeon]